MVKRILRGKARRREHSKIAVAVAGEIAKAAGAELTLLAVNAPTGKPASYAWGNLDLEKVTG